MARILVVDDSETVFFFIQRALKHDHHIVERLSAFTELAHYLRSNEPDLILLDLEMPALSGTQFAQFVRRLERRPTRILIHSSLPGHELARAAREINAVGTLEKSADSQRLREVVRRHLDQELVGVNTES